MQLYYHDYGALFFCFCCVSCLVLVKLCVCVCVCVCVCEEKGGIWRRKKGKIQHYSAH